MLNVNYIPRNWLDEPCNAMAPESTAADHGV